MRHRTNAQVKGSKVIQATAAIDLRDTEGPVNGCMGPEGIALTNNKAGTVKDISSYSEAERARNRFSRGLEKHTVGIYGLSV